MTNALSVRNLTKTYANGIQALKSINLDVKEGDFFALLGQNGAGKSTTIGIVSSLITKTAGEVSIFGYDLDQESAHAKSLIGIVPQELNFGTFENIVSILVCQAGYYGVPRKIAMMRAEKYLKAMGIWNMRKHTAIRLSGGMKRRLMIARALINEPKLLILDEPTAGVDIEIRHTLWHFLRELNDNGTTIILTTHYLEEAEHLCKHVAIIDHGQIIENANMKELLNRLHLQTFLLDFAEPLKMPLHIAGFPSKQIDESTVEFVLERGQTLNELFAILTAQHLQVNSLRNKTNRLEELFLRIVTENRVA